MKLTQKVGVILILIVLIINFTQSSYGKTINEGNVKSKIHNETAFRNDFFDLKIKILLTLGHFPSLSTCIIKNNSIVWYRGYKYSNILHKEKPNLNTVYQGGSVSKMFTATAILQLYEQGYFDLDDDVNHYLNFSLRNPYFPDIPITFRMLLAHRAGLAPKNLKQSIFLTAMSLPCFPKYPYPLIKELLIPEGKLYDKKTWLDDTPPGSDTYYTNYDYMVLEHLVEVISNQTFEAYCYGNIFQPLKMYNTSFHWSDFTINQIAIPYEYFIGKFIPLPYYDSLAGIGGLKTSVEDFSHFLIAHMNNGVWKNIRILQENSIRFMHKVVQYKDQGIYDFGHGWQVLNITKLNISVGGHQGRIPGGDAFMLMNISRDIGVILLFNKLPIRSLEIILQFIILYEIIKKALQE